MYDTHTHLNFNSFKNDYQNIIKKSLKQGMFLNIVGSQLETSKRALKIAEEFKDFHVYAACGLHPTHLNKNDKIHSWNYNIYKKLSESEKVIAIGETGIDKFRVSKSNESLINKQKQVFIEHIKLAKELRKPLIIHCRPSNNSFDAYFDILKILKEYSKDVKGVIHCFLADWSTAKQFLNLGFYISFTGIITYKNADKFLIKTVLNTPLDKILIETDSPYLTPEPLRGKVRNEPVYVKYIAQAVADIKKIDINTVIEKTKQNGIDLFGLKYN